VQHYHHLLAFIEIVHLQEKNDKEKWVNMNEAITMTTCVRYYRLQKPTRWVLS